MNKKYQICFADDCEQLEINVNELVCDKTDEKGKPIKAKWQVLGAPFYASSPLALHHSNHGGWYQALVAV